MQGVALHASRERRLEKQVFLEVVKGAFNLGTFVQQEELPLFTGGVAPECRLGTPATFPFS